MSWSDDPLRFRLGTSSTLPLHARASQHPFSEAFPPPYRVLLLISFGVFCWSLNLHGLNKLGIDTEHLLSSGHRAQLSDSDGLDGDLPLHRVDGQGASPRRRRPASPTSATSDTPRIPKSTYSISAALACWTLANWLLFRHYVTQQGGDPAGRHAQAFQGIAVLAVFVAGFWPGNILWKSTRKRFGQSLLSLILPTPLLMRPPSFPSILLADILTSFAKVFGDVWLTACFLFPRKEHHTWWNGRGSWVAPMLVSLPYAVRLLQCLAEYQWTIPRSRSAMASTSAMTKSRRPLANALKYASAFPLIWISASQSSRTGEAPGEESRHELWYAWLVSVLINSLFSFWWDVTNDWGLQGLKVSTWSAVTLSATAALASNGASSHRESIATRPVHRRGLTSWPAPRGSDGNGADGVDDEEGEDDRLLSNRPLMSNPEASKSNAGHRAGSISTRILRPVNTASADSLSTAMLFPSSVYHIAILLDLVLRFTWSLKLSSHLAQLVELESGVFLLEVAEIARRCGWVFLRVEWEVVKRKRAGWLMKERNEEDDQMELLPGSSRTGGSEGGPFQNG